MHSYDVNDPIRTIFLHGFSDVKEKSFSTCIYIQGLKKSGNILACSSQIACQTPYKRADHTEIRIVGKPHTITVNVYPCISH